MHLVGAGCWCVYRGMFSWTEKSAQLEKNMFPVGKNYFLSWKLEIWGLLRFFVCFFMFFCALGCGVARYKGIKIFDNGWWILR